MKFRLFLLTLLLLSIPVLASGALYQVRAGRLHTTEPGITVDIRYPLVRGLGGDIDTAFNEQSESRVYQMADEFRREARINLQESPESATANAQSLNLDFDTKHLSDRLLALVVSGGEYLGGAHPAPILYSLLVDPKSGRKVSVADLFTPNSDYLSVLSRLSAEELRPRLEDFNTDAEWVAKGTAGKPENFSLVWPGEDGLHVLFPPYQVAPYSSGSPEIVIPYSKLQGVLSSRFFDN